MGMGQVLERNKSKMSPLALVIDGFCSRDGVLFTVFMSGFFTPANVCAILAIRNSLFIQ